MLAMTFIYQILNGYQKNKDGYFLNTLICAKIYLMLLTKEALSTLTIPREVMQFLNYSAITGFIVVTVLLVNLNHKAFNYVLKDNAKKYWWLFVVFAVVPLALFIYAFTFIFGKLVT